MLMSMTGFGKTTGTFQNKKVSIEVRSLNSKSLDLNVRIAPIYREIEAEIRKIILTELDRGKIDLSLNLENSSEQKSQTINQELAKRYHDELKSLDKILGNETKDYLSLILRMPDIYFNEREALDEEEAAWILGLVIEACQQLKTFRRQEGIALENEFTFRIEEIRRLLNEVPKFEAERIDTIRERMKKSLTDLSNVKIDENRFEQELIFYIEKLDVSEEKMRLANHLDYFITTMKSSENGRKLGFISQEIGREINTLGSKSNHAEMQKLVVDMKDNLEKIKEQILNTL